MDNKYQDHEIVIRPARKEDMKAVAQMIQELADFEKMPEGPTLTVADLQRDGFETFPPLFRCKVAELVCPEPKLTEENSLGYAIYFNTYSTWSGKCLMLEDLYVKMNKRGRGVGDRLFNAIAKEAVETDCARLDFHVLEWNPARTFYERKGAVNLTKAEDWCFYRLSGESLQNISMQ